MFVLFHRVPMSKISLGGRVQSNNVIFFVIVDEMQVSAKSAGKMMEMTGWVATDVVNFSMQTALVWTLQLPLQKTLIVIKLTLVIRKILM